MSEVKLETYIFVTWQKFDDFIRYSSRWSKPVLTNKGLQTCDGHTQNFQFTEKNHTIYIDLSKRNLKKIQQQQKSQISHHSSIALLSHIFTFCYRLIFSNACEKKEVLWETFQTNSTSYHSPVCLSVWVMIFFTFSATATFNWESGCWWLASSKSLTMGRWNILS